MKIASDTKDLLSAASASQWGVGYAMLSREYIDQDAAAAFGELKERELQVRQHFDEVLSAQGNIRFAFVAYLDYMILVERPWETQEERDQWRATSGGDMFPRRQFSNLKLGEEVDTDEFHFEQVKDGFMLGVPVVNDGFAGAVYLVFDTETEPK